MKQQINLFFHALMFYSRIPIGKIDYSEENLQKAFRYFPLVGIVVGGIGAGVFALFALVFPSPVAVAATIAAMVSATGAIHEDGFADFFDGFGGGRTKERILAIMKDSAVGTYGVLSLVLLFLAKFSLYLSVAPAALPAVVVAVQASSRFMPIAMINSSHYVRTENSKAAHVRRKVDGVSVCVALFLAAAPFIFIPWKISLAIVFSYFAVFIALKRYTERKIGGFTGDVLGALIQFEEIIFLSVYVAMTPHI